MTPGIRFGWGLAGARAAQTGSSGPPGPRAPHDGNSGPAGPRAPHDGNSSPPGPRAPHDGNSSPAGAEPDQDGAPGPAGALVVVDVLSFSTATTIATGRGTVVYPHPWPSPDVQSFAEAHDAAWAVGRRAVSKRHPWSLSPAHLIAAPAPERLVLPSPNGSAISAASTGCVLAGCIRNASAVARWLVQNGYGTPGKPVTVIAAGERWPDGELRPALEDLLGAAAIIAAFGPGHTRSPEASATEAVWHAHAHQAAEFLLNCFSGRELAQRGFTADVTLAAQHDAQPTVPLLTTNSFHPTTPTTLTTLTTLTTPTTPTTP